MSSSDERFKNIAAGLQSIATMIAILVGGLWTLHTFSALHSTQKAYAEIAVLEQNAFEQPVLQVELQASQVSPESPHPRLVVISAKLRNDGKRLLEFVRPELDVYELTSISEGSMTGKRILAAVAQYGEGDELRDMDARLLRSGQLRTIAFVVDVPTAGNYLFQLTTNYHGSGVLDNKSETTGKDSSQVTASPPSDNEISAIEQIALIIH